MASKTAHKTKLTQVGRIPEDWEVKLLKDISTNVSYGYTASADEEPVGPKFLRITDIVPYFIDWQTVPFCKIENSDKEKYALKMGDIVIARTGANTGANATIKLEKDVVFASYLIRFRIDPKQADHFFVGYVLKSSLWQNFVTSILGGSAQPGANAKQLGFFSLPVPPIEEQQIIARVLGTLDGKIALNHQINQTLEVVGQAVFKRWFVDFEFPNEEGKPYKSSGGEMVYNEEIGKPIPKEWKACTLEEISFNFDSKRVPLSSREREKMQGNYPYYGAAGIIDYVDNFIFDGTYALMGEDGTVVDENGFPVLQLVRGKFWVNNHAHVLQGKGISTELLFLLLKNTNVQHIVTGAVQPKINQGNMNTLKFVIPDEACKGRLQKFVDQLYVKIGANDEQNQALSQIRDLLLLKLMSGKIRVPVLKEKAEAS